MDDGAAGKALALVVDWLAAGILAAAVAVACLKLGAGQGWAAAGGTVSFAAALALLRRVPPEPRSLALAEFAPAPLAFEPAVPGELLLTAEMAVARPSEAVGELLLTPEMRIEPAQHSPAGELLLDDILHSLGPQSRVVRLFDQPPMPTAGELKASIDRHLSSSAPPPQVDASQALHEALAELRRSLR